MSLPVPLTRLARPILIAAVVLEAAWITFVLLHQFLTNPSFGLDYRWHVDAARRLLDEGTPYWAWQLSGPYDISNGAILYPPTTFILFIPFIWLPSVLWWVLPIAIFVGCLVANRPPLWAYALIGALLGLEKSLNVFVFGNPSMWLVAAIAAGTIVHWPFVLVVAKPTFAPIALLGARHRSWWIAAAVFAVASIPFGAVWLDWLAVVRNSNVNLLYNAPTIPLMLTPLVAWLAGRRWPGLARKAGTDGEHVPVQVVR